MVRDAVPGQVVLDAGAKLLGIDRPAFVDGHGLLPDYPEARIARIWEHHGVVEIPDGAARPRLGERVTVVPNHVCATVNLVDELVGATRCRPSPRGDATPDDQALTATPWSMRVSTSSIPHAARASRSSRLGSKARW